MDKSLIALSLLNGNETVEMKDLVGEHTLTGCSKGVIDGSNCISFILDGIPYSAIEDLDDGCRSYLEKIIVGCCDIDNIFEPVEVKCIINNCVLEVFDKITQKIVLRTGTDESESYYPFFIDDWRPENLCLNINRS